MTHDALGDRMKQYEAAAEQVLPARLPVLLRIDGNSFSELTRRGGFLKPFDTRFDIAMETAAMAVLDYADAAQCAFVQSDEITILLRPDLTPTATPFLANRTQKIASLAAGTASVAFNRTLRRAEFDCEGVFDCRVFVVPERDILNAFIWRQLDCYRNCLSSVAYWTLTEREGRRAAARRLHGVNVAGQEALLATLGRPVDSLPLAWRHGRVIRSVVETVPVAERVPPAKLAALVAAGHVRPDAQVERRRWVVDREPPRLHLDRTYLPGTASPAVA